MNGLNGWWILTITAHGSSAGKNNITAKETDLTKRGMHKLMLLSALVLLIEVMCEMIDIMWQSWLYLSVLSNILLGGYVFGVIHCENVIRIHSFDL